MSSATVDLPLHIHLSVLIDDEFNLVKCSVLAFQLMLRANCFQSAQTNFEKVEN